MKYSDEIIKQYLDGHGIPWDQYFVLNSQLPAYRDNNGRLMTLVIEDDAMHSAVQSFLIRMGKTELLGN